MQRRTSRTHLRRIALDLLNPESTSKRGVEGNRLKAGWNHDSLVKVLLHDFAIALRDAMARGLVEIR